jgi:hypothetical protein
LNGAGCESLATIVTAGSLDGVRGVDPDHNIARGDCNGVRIQRRSDGDGVLCHFAAPLVLFMFVFAGVAGPMAGTLDAGSCVGFQAFDNSNVISNPPL